MSSIFTKIQKMVLGDTSSVKMDASTLPAMPAAVQIDYQAMADAQVDALKRIGALNKAELPGLSDLATKLGSSFAQSVNPQIASEYYKYLSDINPNWRADNIGQQQNALTQVANYSQQLMSGKLDQETINDTMRTMAEQGYSKGQFGAFASSNVARNLGLTSMSLKQQGAQMFTEAVSPLSARLLSTTQALMPPLVNTGEMSNQMLGYLAGSLGSGQTAQAGVIQAAQTNADLAWSSRLSAFNAGMDVWTMQQNLNMFNKAVKVQQTNNNRNAIANIGGSALGAYAGSKGG